MIDLTSRPDRFGPGETPEPQTVNELIQARIDGRISRRGLIRRAAALGISAPVVGVMLHATSDMAYGRPSLGRAMALRARLQSEGTVPADAPTEPAGEPQEGGTVTVGHTNEPDTLNPYVTQLVSTGDVLSAVMDGLLVYDSKQQLQPALAEGFEISEDGLTYTFQLRQGVKFHNGDTFGPQDVIDTWKMIMNPDFGAFGQLGWDKIEDITSPDGVRLVMTTTEVYAPFLSFVSPESISPAKELAKGPDAFKQEFGRAPIGTGPFKLTEWKAKQEIVLDKFADYWGPKAKLDRVIYRNVGDDNTLLVQLRTGETQVTRDITAARVDEALGFEGVTVLEHPTQAWQHIDLKHIDFLRMTKVRQALDFATPSQQIIDQLLKGRATPCIADQAPGTWAYNPNIQPRPYDLEQAKKLLAEAGLEPGSDGVLEGKAPKPDAADPNAPPEGEVKRFELELWGVSGNTTDQQIVQIVAQSWNQIGVKTSTHFEDVSTIWGPEGYQFTDKMTGCLYTWFNANDPDDMFYWHSSQIPDSPTGSGGNLPAYFHHYNFQEEIDRLTEAGVRETDQEKRREIYWQIQELLHEEVPVIFMYWEKAFPAVADNIGGYWPSAFVDIMWNVRDWYLTQ